MKPCNYGRFGKKSGPGSIPDNVESLTINGNTDGTEPQVVNIMYGTGVPPSPVGIPDGTIYLQYVP